MLTQKKGGEDMKRLAIPFLALTLILGMTPMAMALDDGTYDFYGTFSVDWHYADGVGQACALTAGGLSCPSSANFCIKNLDVTSNIITSNEGSPYYGIAVGKMVGSLVTLDFDGDGSVNLTVDDTGNADSLTSMITDIIFGPCIYNPCVHSWSTSIEPPTGGSGTVTGWIPVLGPGVGQPSEFRQCPFDSGSYGSPELTTETAESEISNEFGWNQTRSESGSDLVGSGPWTMTLKNPHATHRTNLGGIYLQTDVLSINTWDGTLCIRSSPDTSCIPGGFTCPAEAD